MAIKIGFKWLFIAVVLGIFMSIDVCNGHGRLIQPPGRSTAWRYGFKTPINYDDDEIYCGGLGHKIKLGGKCGECGDPWDAPQPRPNEYGGKYGKGVIVAKYKQGEVITIKVQLTTSHSGYFEFRVCDDKKGKQDCFDKHLLEIESGKPSTPKKGDLKTRFYIRNGTTTYEINARLPEGLECTNCVLQWIYIAGNNWGICPDGSGAMGCGDQEEFRACSDIAIVN